jgi:hypothetical protein
LASPPLRRTMDLIPARFRSFSHDIMPLAFERMVSKSTKSTTSLTAPYSSLRETDVHLKTFFGIVRLDGATHSLDDLLSDCQAQT